MRIHDVWIEHDGDPKRGDRGELSFALQINGDSAGDTPEKKSHSNRWYDLETSFLGRHPVGPVADQMAINLTIIETDHGSLQFCTVGDGVRNSADRFHDGKCDTTWNPAIISFFSYDGFTEADRCSNFGVYGSYANDYCRTIGTAHTGDGYAEFQAVLSFRAD